MSARRRASALLLVGALVCLGFASRGARAPATGATVGPVSCVRDPAADGRFVELLYASLLGRAGTAAEVAAWVGRFPLPTSLTYLRAATGFTTSLEHRERTVRQLYAALLHRSPDAKALLARATALGSRTSTDLAASLIGSTEFWIGAGGTATGFVAAVYHDVLGRSPDPAKLASWASQVAAGDLTPAGLGARFWQTAEHRSQRVAALYGGLLGRAPGTAALAERTAQLATHDDPWLAAALAASPEFWTRAQVSYGGVPTVQPPPCPPPCTAVSAVAAWSVRERLAQLLTVGVASSGNADRVLALAKVRSVGGVIVRSGSVSIYADARLGTARTPRGVLLFIGTDQEGGRVDRLAPLLGALPSARTMAATMTPAQVRARAKVEGAGMRAHGLNVDFAPDADVSDQPPGGPIGDRSFSNDPGVVTAYAGAFAQGLRDAGVLPVFKHFPGHGHATGDSETGPAVTPPLASLEADDLLPYGTLLGTAPTAVMVGHLTVPGLTQPGFPASVSPQAINGLLRTHFGFRGLVFTDSLNMDAISATLSPATAVRHALTAGADEALLVNDIDVGALLDHLTKDVGSGAIPTATLDAAVLRVLATKHFDPCS